MRDFPRVLRPNLPFSPDTARDLSAVLREAIAVLRDWGLPVRAEGRLWRAAQHLENVSAHETLSTDPDDLARTAQAAALAADFYQIAASLADVRDDPIANELKVALGGTLDSDSLDTSAYEVQSQFWVGVMLAQAGLRPALAVGMRRTPDFLVSVGELTCGVEVKRPRRLNAAMRVLSDAAKQLREHDAPGLIAVDLSGALRTRSFVLPQDGISARQIISRKFYDVAERMGTYIHRYDRSAKYSHVIALFSFARFWSWSSVDPPISDAGIFFTVTIFPNAYSGLLVDHAMHLQELLRRGVEKVTGNPVQAEWK